LDAAKKHPEQQASRTKAALQLKLKKRVKSGDGGRRCEQVEACDKQHYRRHVDPITKKGAENPTPKSLADR
jgi:hypothetical protein